MSHAFVTTEIVARWNEAIVEPTYARWHSLAFWAAQLADAMEENHPDDIMLPCLRAVYQAAYARMIVVEPQEATA